jgi:hypothetical protein
MAESGSAQLTISAGQRASRATMRRLIASRIDDTTDVTLGESVVGTGGEWMPSAPQSLPVKDGSFTLEIPAASAALITLI